MTELFLAAFPSLHFCEMGIGLAGKAVVEECLWAVIIKAREGEGPDLALF